MIDLKSILEDIVNIQNRIVELFENNKQQSFPDNITTMGNQFNGANQLVKLDQNGQLPGTVTEKIENVISANHYTKQQINALVNYKIWIGTQSQYNKLNIDQNTIYFITD